MSVSVTMPRLGESVSEGTVTRWLKKPGERVEADEPLLEVSTDKVDTEIPSPAAGILGAILVNEDETVDVGVELATIDDGTGGAPAPAAAETPDPIQADAAPLAPGNDAAAAPTTPADASDASVEKATGHAPSPEPTPVAAPAPAPAAAPSPAPAAATPAPAAAPSGGDPYVTPLVRQLATEHGVDLSSLVGTGVGGRIRKQDVLDAASGNKAAPAGAPASSQPAAVPAAPAAAKAPAPAAAAAAPTAAPQAAAPAPAAPRPAVTAATTRGTTERLTPLRKTIATRMVESLHVAAQLTTVVEADVTKIARLRQQAKGSFEAREGVKLSFLPFFALAAIEALKVHPVVNASLDIAAGTVTYPASEHLGIAVDTPRGLLVPVIKDAGDLNLGGIARKIADLAERTRTNKVTPDELGGGTFTLTNTGSRGALFDTPIINQPQSAILGTGTVVKRAVVVDDPALGEVIAVRSIVYLALSYDHRIVDGADAARYLATMKARLEEGAFEAELGL